MKKKLSLKELKNNNDKCYDPKMGCRTPPPASGS